METKKMSTNRNTIKKKKLKIQNIYTESILSRPIIIDINDIDDNIKKTLEAKLVKTIEGKCTCEGFVKPDSCKIISYSSGLVKSGNQTGQSSIEYTSRE